MAEKRPILIWRLKDAPSEVEETLIEGGFLNVKEHYRKWRAGKTGNEFVVFVPDEYVYHDRDVAADLGIVNADGDEPKVIDDLFTDLHYDKEKYKAWEGYHAFVIPSLVGRKAAPASKAE